MISTESVCNTSEPAPIVIVLVASRLSTGMVTVPPEIPVTFVVSEATAVYVITTSLVTVSGTLTVKSNGASSVTPVCSQLVVRVTSWSVWVLTVTVPIFSFVVVDTV